MKSLFLRRIAMSDMGTFGVMVEDDSPLCIPICTTLEPPDKNNKENESCIPEGPYICKRDTTGRWNNTFEVADVEGRTEIEFHTGNYLHNTKGCILIGEGFDNWNGEPVITHSKDAFDRFMQLLAGVDEFPLTIQNSYLYGTLKSPMGPHGASLK